MGIIPAVVWLMSSGETVVPGAARSPNANDIWAGWLFTAAALTDFLDGYIARKFNVETVLGKLLDPLADKLLVVSALIILVEKQRLAGWVAVLLIVRDLGINAIRLAAMEDNLSVPSSWIGKTKTFFLDFGIVGLTVYGWKYGVPWLWVGWIGVWAAVVASVVSALQYLWSYARLLRSAGNPPAR